MATSAQRLADLEQQVADLATEMQHLQEQAFTLMTLEQIVLKHQVLYPGQSDTAEPSRPRHLVAVQGGQP
jgi:hypothetical protein